MAAVDPLPSADKLHFTLHPGEKLLSCTKNITHICPFDGPIAGTLYITNYKLVFENAETHERKSKRSTDWKGNGFLPYDSQNPGPEVALGLIARVEKMGGQSTRKEGAYGLELACADMRTLRFGFVPDQQGRKSLYELLMTHAFPASFNLEFFAFEHAPKYEMNDGWNLYSTERELRRVLSMDGSGWRLTTANTAYGLCATYPSVIAVPEAVDDATLTNAATFRTRGRLPVLSWVHPETRASLTRCSQPKVGPWRRNEQDETLIKAIRETNPNSARLVIIDARPKVNAVANQAKGAGYENAEVYENTSIQFMNIPNIHVIRESHHQLLDCCFNKVDDGHWYARLEHTQWHEYLKLILQTTVTAVDLIDRQATSVMVHCSDGWDRTPQIVSLAMLLLDPYYRTLPGFCILLEKEWAAFGHKFMQRFGQGNKDYSDDQRAPIFLQFLDCVYQVMLQFPTALEFNQALLILLSDEVHKCRFGTFLFNSEKERLDKQVRERTPSLWSYVLSNARTFSNPLFLNSAEVLVPVIATRKIQVWTDNYMRWSPQARKPDVTTARHWELKSLVDDLQGKVSDLENKLKR